MHKSRIYVSKEVTPIQTNDSVSSSCIFSNGMSWKLINIPEAIFHRSSGQWTAIELCPFFHHFCWRSALNIVRTIALSILWIVSVWSACSSYFENYDDCCQALEYWKISAVRFDTAAECRCERRSLNICALKRVHADKGSSPLLANIMKKYADLHELNSFFYSKAAYVRVEQRFRAYHDVCIKKFFAA